MIGQSNGQLRALIDRVIRLKGEQDTLQSDIKEIYAEAKASGFDKTVMGKIVAHLRKIEKDGAAKADEAESLFSLYLQAYEAGGTEFATRAHPHETAHDPVTGEVAA